MSIIGRAKSFVERNKKIVLPIAIILAGFIGMKLLVLSRSAPKKEVKMPEGVLVETLPAKHIEHTVLVYGNGTVEATKKADIVVEVSGKVSYVSPNLVTGGFFKKGDLLFRMDPEDYKLKLEQAEANVAKAEYELATTESRARVARLEWERLGLEQKDEEPNPLVTYEPQLKNARADLRSAKAALKMAELDLARTRVYAPFDCRVSSKDIDVGEYVRVGTVAATITGTETAEVIVPLPIEELEWLEVPQGGSKRTGSKASVILTIGSERHTWNGVVLRSLGEVDPMGRMPRIAISVSDPYNLYDKDDKGAKRERPELELGVFVDVILIGVRLNDVVTIPRSALREDSKVWVVGDEDKLGIKPVEVIRRERETVILNGKDLEEGELVVLTNVTGAAEGLLLRPVAGSEGL